MGRSVSRSHRSRRIMTLRFEKEQNHGEADYGDGVRLPSRRDRVTHREHREQCERRDERPRVWVRHGVCGARRVVGKGGDEEDFETPRPMKSIRFRASRSRANTVWEPTSPTSIHSRARAFADAEIPTSVVWARTRVEHYRDMASTSGGVVCPGEPLRFAEEFRAGAGTYVRDQHVVAAVVGTARVVPSSEESGDKRPVVEVVQGRVSIDGSSNPTTRAGGSLIPTVGDEVFARVTRVNPRLCNCEILTVNGVATEDSFSGVIRTQDIRVTETDKIDMYDCFVPGDIVRAKILSLGDTRSYYLTTAANELGVVRAKSPFTGELMVAASWEEMECPTTGQRCKRKVAKIV